MKNIVDSTAAVTSATGNVEAEGSFALQVNYATLQPGLKTQANTHPDLYTSGIIHVLTTLGENKEQKNKYRLKWCFTNP